MVAYGLLTPTLIEARAREHYQAHIGVTLVIDECLGMDPKEDWVRFDSPRRVTVVQTRHVDPEMFTFPESEYLEARWPVVGTGAAFDPTWDGACTIFAFRYSVDADPVPSGSRSTIHRMDLHPFRSTTIAQFLVLIRQHEEQWYPEESYGVRMHPETPLGSCDERITVVHGPATVPE